VLYYEQGFAFAFRELAHGQAVRLELYRENALRSQSGDYVGA
jgi:hypothetical protein